MENDNLEHEGTMVDPSDAFKYFRAFLQHKIEQGARQVDIARDQKVDVRPEYISRIYRGKQGCSASLQQSIAEYFGLSYREALDIGQRILDNVPVESGSEQALRREGDAVNSATKAISELAPDEYVEAVSAILKARAGFTRKAHEDMKAAEREAEYWHSIFEVMGDALSIVEVSGKEPRLITFQNQTHRNVFGDCEQKTCEECGQYPLHAVAASGVVTRELWSRGKETYHVTATPIRDTKGHVTLIVCSIKDVTERHNEFVAVKDEVDRLKHLTCFMDTGMLSMDEQLNITSRNEAFLALSGASPVDLVNFSSLQRFLEFKSSDFSAKAERLKDAIQSRTSISIIATLNDKRLLWNLEPIFRTDENDERVGLLGFGLIVRNKQ